MKLLATILLSTAIAGCAEHPYRHLSYFYTHTRKDRICWSNLKDLEACNKLSDDKRSECGVYTFTTCGAPAAVIDTESCAASLEKRHPSSKRSVEAVQLFDTCMEEKGWGVVYGDNH